MTPSTPGTEVAAVDPVRATGSEDPGSQSSEPRILSVGRVLVLIVALAILILGLAGGLLGLAMALMAQGTERLTATTVSASILALTLGLGLPLAWHAWRSLQGQGSSIFRPKRAWPLIAAFLVALAGGQTILELGLLPSLLFPPFHVVAAVAPPLAILALVARGLRRPGRWRDLVLQLSSGAFLATPLAFLVEGALIFGLVVLLLTGLALQPGGSEALDALAENPMLQDPEALLPLLLSPGTIIAALLITALFVPLVEELAKAIGVGLVAYRQPDAQQAMLWGLAGGAGFAMVEGLLNTAGSFPSWAPVIVLRVGASLLHCTAGALMGLAWRQLLVRRSWGPALGLYAASAAMHAAWNTVSVGVAFLSLGSTSPGAPGISQELAGLGSLGLVAFLVVLAGGLALLLAALTRRLAGSRQPGGEELPVSDLPASDLPMEG